jgi:hypothetical protein
VTIQKVRVRYFVVPPSVCDFSTQRVNIPIEEGIVATTTDEVVRACLDNGFMEISDPAGIEDAHQIMASKMADRVYEAASYAGKSETLARAEVRIALASSGFDIPAGFEAPTPPPKVHKPKVAKQQAAGE